MNLYLDDIRPMPYAFDTLARTLDEAKTALSSGLVEHCSLDHDLGACDDCLRRGGATTITGRPLTTDERYQASLDWLRHSRGTAMPNCEHVGTGKNIVLWMIDSGHWPRHKPTVHSANPVGAKIMRQLIDEHWKEPTT